MALAPVRGVPKQTPKAPSNQLASPRPLRKVIAIVNLDSDDEESVPSVQSPVPLRPEEAQEEELEELEELEEAEREKEEEEEVETELSMESAMATPPTPTEQLIGKQKDQDTTELSATSPKGITTAPPEERRAEWEELPPDSPVD